MSRHQSNAIREREPPINLVFYHLFNASVVFPLSHLYFRRRVYGAEHVPTSGPLVVVSNHASDFDPPLLSSCVGRPVAYMAKEELFRVPLLKQAIQVYGAYPVKRGTADRSAIRAALEKLEMGWAVGIFLQGTRTPDARIPSPKLGAALIAAKAQVPLLPVSLWGTEKIIPKRSTDGGNGDQGKQVLLPRSTPITVRIAAPIAPPATTDRDDLMATTRNCTDIIHTLHDLGR